MLQIGNLTILRRWPKPGYSIILYNYVPSLTLIKNNGEEVEIGNEKVAKGTEYVFAKDENHKVCGIIIYKGEGNGIVLVGNLAEKTGPDTDRSVIAKKVSSVCVAIKSTVRFIYSKSEASAS
jgi:hypothetical protein